MRSLYEVKEVPQIPSMNCWRRSAAARPPSAATTAPRCISAASRTRSGRLMVLMSHNTDIADTWEREGESQEYFDRFSPRGYAVGVNVVIYAMTH